MQHIIKFYDWKALLRLIMADVRRVHGVQQIEGKFNYISGLDTDRNVYIRVDLKPLQLPDERSEGG